jgi:hypothetical protein
MKRMSFYSEETGLFHDKTMTVSDQGVVSAGNIPQGHKPMEGVFDRLAQRVDLATGKVVAYMPPCPKPEEDHVWNSAIKRWQLTAAAMARATRSSSARSLIRDLEGKTLRALREVALGQPGAKERLAALDAKIAELRGDLMPEPGGKTATHQEATSS